MSIEHIFLGESNNKRLHEEHPSCQDDAADVTKVHVDDLADWLEAGLVTVLDFHERPLLSLHS